MTNNNTTNNDETVVIATAIDPQIVNITPISCDINEQMKIVYSYGYTIKILCFIDIFISILYAVYSPLLFIPIIFAFCGLFGVKNYNYHAVLCYFIFEAFVLITRLITFFYIVSCCSENIYFFNTVFLILATIVGIWILEILYKYIKNLRDLSIEQINILRTIHHIPTARVVYY